MKIGDFAGWADTWTDEEGCDPAGIILECCDDNDRHVQYLVLMHHTGELSWEYGSDLVVIFESR